MKSLIVGNWKLYVNTLDGGAKLLRAVDKKFPRGVKAEVVVCPEVSLTVALRKSYGGRRIAFGTQDVSADSDGAHTGSISTTSLKSSGIEYVILGHAEMRDRGETSETVSKKTAAAISAKLHPIVCVGEPERDQEGAHFTALAKSVTESLARIPGTDANRLTVAYDPKWAIGEAEPPSARVVSEGIIFIRKTLADMWGREPALKTRIIYGGSVTPETAKGFLKEANAQGLLIGRASVDPDSFTAIIKGAS